MTSWLPCRAPGCAELVQRPGGFCGECTKKRDGAYRAKRREEGHARLYDRRWDSERKLFLRAHPFCQCAECAASDRPDIAEVLKP
jgi:5-methylcytosine-specific restriction protein A